MKVLCTADMTTTEKNDISFYQFIRCTYWIPYIFRSTVLRNLYLQLLEQLTFISATCSGAKGIAAMWNDRLQKCLPESTTQHSTRCLQQARSLTLKLTFSEDQSGETSRTSAALKDTINETPCISWNLYRCFTDK